MNVSLAAVGLNEASKYFAKTSKNAALAVPYAQKKIGFKYRKIMASETAKGAPGGEKQAPLSIVFKRYRKGTGKRGRAVAGGDLGRLMRNKVQKRRPFDLEIGLLDSGPYAAPADQRKRAEKQVAGYTTPVSPRVRALFGRYGSSKRGKQYALRKTTTILRTPPRPIVGGFRRKYLRVMVKDWERAYWAKIKGESIRI